MKSSLSSKRVISLYGVMKDDNKYYDTVLQYTMKELYESDFKLNWLWYIGISIYDKRSDVFHSNTLQ
ncbi:11620_t:CDS:2 [Gigaspora margarita]|uniref:11620_t:CDS:1 n=1 Tax=Gigaspora margarita TaxID=4874 RepID=A0ABM8VZT3_GIGMA|nr:11620_t:CDS:2 [Gigaspora margarita]